MDIKRTIAAATTSALGRLLLQPITRIATTPCAIVFMLHRFNPTERRWGEHDPTFITQVLEEIRRLKLSVVPIDDIVQSHINGEPIDETRIAITIDDGFIDQAEIGASLITRYDMPATIYATTDFLDDLWWPLDVKAQFIIDNSEKRSIERLIEGRKQRFNLDDDADRWALYNNLVAQIRDRTLTEGDLLVQNFARECAVDLPSKPPAAFRPMTWAQGRQLEKQGISIGPHTKRHPLLSRESAQDSRDEILGSIERVRAELTNPCQVFCYPTGRYGDFSDREYEILKSSSCMGAVSAEPGYIQARKHSEPDMRFSIPRFSMPDNLHDLRQILLYLEFLKNQARRLLGRA